MSLRLHSETGERPLFGGADYYLSVRHKSYTYTAHCVYYFALLLLTFFFCLLFKEGSLNPHLPPTIQPLFTYYCIIDGDALHVALERNLRNDFFSPLVVFVCLLRRVKLKYFWGISYYSAVSSLIQQYKLLTYVLTLP